MSLISTLFDSRGTKHTHHVKALLDAFKTTKKSKRPLVEKDVKALEEMLDELQELIDSRSPLYPSDPDIVGDYAETAWKDASRMGSDLSEDDKKSVVDLLSGMDVAFSAVPDRCVSVHPLLVKREGRASISGGPVEFALSAKRQEMGEYGIEGIIKVSLTATRRSDKHILLSRCAEYRDDEEFKVDSDLIRDQKKLWEEVAVVCGLKAETGMFLWAFVVELLAPEFDDLRPFRMCDSRLVG